MTGRAVINLLAAIVVLLCSFIIAVTAVHAVYAARQIARPNLTHEEIIQAIAKCDRSQLQVRIADDGRGRPVEAWCGSAR
jgi:hypothetical protein